MLELSLSGFQILITVTYTMQLLFWNAGPSSARFLGWEWTTVSVKQIRARMPLQGEDWSWIKILLFLIVRLWTLLCCFIMISWVCTIRGLPSNFCWCCLVLNFICFLPPKKKTHEWQFPYFCDSMGGLMSWICIQL